MLEEVCRGRGYSCGASDALVATAVRAPRDEAPSARSPSRTPSSRAAAAEHARGKATRRPRRRSPESGDATARCAARHAAAATRTRRDDARACAPWLRHRRGGCVSSCPLLLLLAPRRARARVGGLHRAFCARCAVCVHQMRPLCQRDRQKIRTASVRRPKMCMTHQELRKHMQCCTHTQAPPSAPKGARGAGDS